MADPEVRVPEQKFPGGFDCFEGLMFLVNDYYLLTQILVPGFSCHVPDLLMQFMRL